MAHSAQYRSFWRSLRKSMWFFFMVPFPDSRAVLIPLPELFKYSDFGWPDVLAPPLTVSAALAESLGHSSWQLLICKMKVASELISFSSTYCASTVTCLCSRALCARRFSKCEGSSGSETGMLLFLIEPAMSWGTRMINSSKHIFWKWAVFGVLSSFINTFL